SIRVGRGGSRRISARNVTLLPEPDSPRMHSTSPACTLKLTPFTACTVASRVTNRTLRSRTSANGAAPFSAISSPPGPAVARKRVVHMARSDMRLQSPQPPQQRIGRLADGLGERAAGVKPATLGRIDRVGWIADDRRLIDPLRRVHRRPRREKGPCIG